jgi:hypothetical protein
LFFALLKPIVKVPEIIVAFLTLLELVKITKTIVIFWEVVCGIILLILLLIGIWCRRIEGFIIGRYGRPNRGSWRPFFRQWYAGRHQGNALRTFGFALRWLRCLDDDVGLRVCETLLVCVCAWDITIAGLIGVDLLDYGLGNH